MFTPLKSTSLSLNNTKGSTMILETSPKWRSMVDNCMIEFIAALLLILATVFCWSWKEDNIFLQFVPPLAMGLILLCLKDEDYFFPDGAWFVTLVLWALGGYGSWTHVVARLVGQTAAMGVAWWVCSLATLSDIVHHTHQPLSIVFFMEMLCTAIEHLAVVYVVMPLLPPPSHHHGFLFPKVKPKSDQATRAPSNTVVMHAAITFSTLHWCLWRGLHTEMNPAITLVLAYLRVKQNPTHADQEWQHATISVWGQIVGVALCIAYTAVYFPRESKMWRNNTPQ